MKSLGEDWQRFRYLLRQTPTRGFDEALQINMLLGGLRVQSKLMLDASVVMEPWFHQRDSLKSTLKMQITNLSQQFKLETASSIPTFKCYVCESCRRGHATYECVKVHEEMQCMNNHRQGSYKNYNNQGYRPHPSIGEEQRSISNVMPRENLYENTSKLEKTLTQLMQIF
ncbi:hypothetical protein GmHk_03G007051 [Glycine max]|nr:hypothetical protein GmHk_03G007051 [Glycine max]